MPDTPETERPTWACVLHLPPTDQRKWAKADDGYRTCSSCYDRLRDLLKDIMDRFGRLDASPGGTGDHGGRGAPGFGSRPAGSPHIITMTDRRSKSHEVSWDGTQYVWDPLADTTLEPGQYGPPGGAYVEKRDVWYGADGRAHAEEARPPRSIPGSLESLATLIAEERDLAAPAHRTVPDLVRWIDGHLDWLTRHPLVEDVERELKELDAQLKPVTGDPRFRIGTCPNTIDEGETTRSCEAKLYAPLRGDTIICGSCGRKWPRPEWEDLGRLLQGETLQQAS